MLYYFYVNQVIVCNADSDSEKETPSARLQQGVAQKGKISSTTTTSQDKTELEMPSQSTRSETRSDNQGGQLPQTQNSNIASNMAKNSNKPVAMVEPVQQHREGRDVQQTSPPASPQQDEVSQPAEQTREKPKFDLVTELKRGCLLT